MKDQTRKLLTEYLGECWHNTRLIVTHCDTCKCAAVNRTFTTPDDMDALRRKMVEKGKIGSFINWGLHDYPCEPGNNIDLFDYFSWLMEPERFCELAGKWIEGKGKWHSIMK